MTVRDFQNELDNVWMRYEVPINDRRYAQQRLINLFAKALALSGYQKAIALMKKRCASADYQYVKRLYAHHFDPARAQVDLYGPVEESSEFENLHVDNLLPSVAHWAVLVKDCQNLRAELSLSHRDVATAARNFKLFLIESLGRYCGN